jgi:hypothetical protein
MFSVENFYFILKSNLLDSEDILSFYFRTFGSTDPADLIPLNLPNASNKINFLHIPKAALVFYDQEPLNESIVWKERFASRPEMVLDTSYGMKILANSEQSDFKQTLCQENNLVNWYYFYHGFAALDWYRDYQYVDLDAEFDKKFICLNRILTGDRSYRLLLVAMLFEHDLVDHGHVSLHTGHHQEGAWQAELENPYSKLNLQQKNLIQNHLTTLTGPLLVDTSNICSTASAHAGANEMTLNQSALWHIVTETVFYYNKLHLTEKIFKPIVSKRPFILVGAPGNLAYLKSYGFQTFDKWIDESYDAETDNNKRMEMVVEQIKYISSLSMPSLKKMQQEMQEVLLHNKTHFYSQFKKIIVDELVDNFSNVIQQWNLTCSADRIIDCSYLDFEIAKNKLVG